MQFCNMHYAGSHITKNVLAGVINLQVVAWLGLMQRSFFPASYGSRASHNESGQ